MKTLSNALISILLISGLNLQAQAKNDKKNSPMIEPTKEQRSNMASVHEKMATCLRSDKTATECRQEMRHSCQSMGDEACPMMGQRGMEKMKYYDKKDTSKE